MKYLPLMLDLNQKPVVLLGGGPETLSRIHSLLEAGALLTVIAPEPSAGLSELALDHKINWQRREYLPGDLAGYWLAVSEPKDRSINRLIAEEAHSGRIFLLAIDDRPNTSAISPAIHRQGQLTIAISTGGQAPALAVRIKQRLAHEYGPEYALLLDLLGEARAAVRQNFPDPAQRKALWYQLVDSNLIELLRAGEINAAQTLLAELIQPREPL